MCFRLLVRFGCESKPLVHSMTLVAGNKMTKLSGFATSEGTSHYRDRFQASAANGHFRNEQDLTLSSLGIGTYLGNPDEATDKAYEDTIVRAVQLGMNVIDSAANYRFQRSERAVGRALRKLTREHEFMREEVVVCTKGGYLPFDGAPPRDVRAYVEETFVRPGIASFEEIVGGSHCMTPAYLQNQLDQSLENMALSCVDVYYVHNPESQLGSVSADDFYSRLRKAFELLEKNIAAGKIRKYGVATWNGFRTSDDSEGYHSLSLMIEQARAVGGESHGFRFIQLPYNLAMPEAFTLENQMLGGRRLSVLEVAAAEGVTVVASASILQGRVAAGLPENLRESLGSLATDAQTAIQFVRSTPGITTALVGMSDRKHVEENAQLLKVEPLSGKEFLKLFS
jgi:aryl-alcohol dehydrogenase-like predicted oxidoreductase